ncbi:hypothetical protein AWC38_SpisGene3407 [Stylophora pistillata]|uniref:Uncharacterized protein n=1 Tax=Stylophora pistillata TaxID=50429 RepID=A0A2B4SPF4_STYPI|nr:hypothetical protein AWC38_SpisGene3407 [Stylophora pistillata]
MEPDAQEQKQVQSAVYTIQDGQIELARLQKQLTQLEERFDKYFNRLDELEKSCARMQKDLEITEQMIKEEHVFMQEQLAPRKTEKAATPQETAMRYGFEKRPTFAINFSLREGEGSPVARLERQRYLLERQLEQYFRDLDELERLCKLAKEQMETSKRRITEKYEGIRKNTERELQLIAARRENGEERRRQELVDAAISQRNQEPKAELTTSDMIFEVFKLVCSLVLDILVVYAVFKIAKCFWMTWSS